VDERDERDERDDWYFRDKVLLPGQGHAWTAHEHAAVTLVVFGRLDEGLAVEVQRCGVFELHYKPPGLRHTTSTGPSGVRMLLVGLRETALEGLEACGRDRPRTVSGGARAARALAELLAIAESHRERHRAPRPAILRLWECLESHEPSAADRPAWITEVHERVRSEDADRHDLPRLAREFGVHPVYLARAFRSAYGLTIGSLRRRLRADRAVARLLAGRASLAELALELGYADQSHFTREFKRETGWTPARFAAAAAPLARLREVQTVQDRSPATA
jgi:AraC family transcriptional regulator